MAQVQPAIAASIKVRRYLSSDIGKILELARRASESVHLPFTAERLKFVLDNNLNNVFLCCLVLTDLGETMGMLIAQAKKTTLTDGMVADTEMFYTEPEYRTGNEINLIMSEYKDWARARGCRELRMVNTYMPEAVESSRELI